MQFEFLKLKLGSALPYMYIMQEVVQMSDFSVLSNYVGDFGLWNNAMKPFQPNLDALLQ